jgi:hypothetical protein
MLYRINLEEWLTIGAIILGPVLAFAIQHWRDGLREARKRRLQIFQQLLLTLKVPMAPRHVDALNSVPLDFSSDTKVMQAWRLYTSHLNDGVMLKNNPQRWGERKFELLVDLASEMASNLGYDHIDKASLRDNIYVPQGYADQEEESRQMRAAMLQVLRGDRPIPMTMVGPVQVAEPLRAVEELPLPEQPKPTILPPVKADN